MCALGFVAVLAATAIAGGASAQQCQLKEVVSYDMVPIGTGHFGIPFVIDGKTELMLVDTGGFVSTLGANGVADLGLTPTAPLGTVAYDVHGQPFNRIATAPSVTVGVLTVPNVDFIVAPSRDDYGKAIAGTIGPNILRNFDVDLDFAKSKLNIFAPDHCPGQVVYWTTSGFAQVPFRMDASLHIEIPMTLDGQSVDAIIDTGAPTSDINRSTAYRLFGVEPGSPGTEEVKYTGSDGVQAVRYRHRFTTLSVGGITINNPELYLLADEMGRQAAEDDRDPTDPQLHLPALILGLSELRALHLYIAYKEKILYVTAADAD